MILGLLTLMLMGCGGNPTTPSIPATPSKTLTPTATPLDIYGAARSDPLVLTLAAQGQFPAMTYTPTFGR